MECFDHELGYTDEASWNLLENWETQKSQLANSNFSNWSVLIFMSNQFFKIFVDFFRLSFYFL